MKLATLFITSVFIAQVLGGPMVTSDTLVTSSGKRAVQAYREGEFLNVPLEVTPALWRVREGALQSSSDKGVTWMPASVDFLTHPLDGNWDQANVGGLIAVGRQPFAVEPTLDSESIFKALAIVEDHLLEFSCQLKQTSPGFFVPEIIIQRSKMDGRETTQVASFEFASENFQYRLAAAIPLSEKFIGLIAGTEHPHVNSLIFFNLQTNKPEGQISYAEIAYLPKQGVFQLTDPLPRSMDNEEALQLGRNKIRNVRVPQESVEPNAQASELFREVRSISSSQTGAKRGPSRIRVFVGWALTALDSAAIFLGQNNWLLFLGGGTIIILIIAQKMRR